MRYIIFALALVLSGCATDPLTTNLVLQAQKEAYQRPTISMTCPAGGCSLTYHDPRDTSPFKMPTNGWDAVVSVSNNVTGIAQAMVVPAAMGYVATKGFNALKGSGAINNTTTIGPSNSGNTTPTTTTNTTTGPSNSGNTTTTPTTTTNTTTGPSNSGNTTTTPSTTTTSTSSTTNTNSGNTVPSTTTVTTTGSNNTTPAAPAAP